MQAIVEEQALCHVFRKESQYVKAGTFARSSRWLRTMILVDLDILATCWQVTSTVYTNLPTEPQTSRYDHPWVQISKW